MDIGWGQTLYIVIVVLIYEPRCAHARILWGYLRGEGACQQSSKSYTCKDFLAGAVTVVHSSFLAMAPVKLLLAACSFVLNQGWQDASC